MSEPTSSVAEESRHAMRVVMRDDQIGHPVTVQVACDDEVGARDSGGDGWKLAKATRAVASEHADSTFRNVRNDQVEVTVTIHVGDRVRVGRAPDRDRRAGGGAKSSATVAQEHGDAPEALMPDRYVRAAVPVQVADRKAVVVRLPSGERANRGPASEIPTPVVQEHDDLVGIVRRDDHVRLPVSIEVSDSQQMRHRHDKERSAKAESTLAISKQEADRIGSGARGQDVGIAVGVEIAGDDARRAGARMVGGAGRGYERLTATRLEQKEEHQPAEEGAPRLASRAKAR